MSRSPLDDRRRDIESVIELLDEGEVTTYGDVAADAGYPRHARFVGRVLATSERDLPWWRVVRASGHLAPGKERRQAELLRAEGVFVIDNRVVSAPIGRFAKH